MKGKLLSSGFNYINKWRLQLLPKTSSGLIRLPLRHRGEPEAGKTMMIKRYFSVWIDNSCFSRIEKIFKHHYFPLADKVILNINHIYYC